MPFLVKDTDIDTWIMFDVMVMLIMADIWLCRGIIYPYRSLMWGAACSSVEVASRVRTRLRVFWLQLERRPEGQSSGPRKNSQVIKSWSEKRLRLMLMLVLCHKLFVSASVCAYTDKLFDSKLY